jgi:L,D-transpeptidase catalytic domain/Bacterial Ig-like domain
VVQIGAHDERPSPASQASEAGGESAESPRSLSPSGTFPSDADLPGAPASVPPAASPSGAWPADARPIRLTDSVFTPWSARQAPGSDSHDSASPPSQREPGHAAAARRSRPSASAHDPLSGPWPSFTRRTGETASWTIPAKQPADVEQPVAAGSEEAADTPAAAAETGAGDVFPSPAGGPAWSIEPASPLGATEFTVFDVEGLGGLGGYPSGGGPAGMGGPIVPAGRRRMLTLVGVAAAVVGLVIAGGIYLYVQKASAAHAAGDNRGKTAGHVPKMPEHVVSITPAEGSTSVDGAADIRVEFSAPLSPHSPMPTLKPAIDGTWQRHGNTAVFVPDTGFKQRMQVTVRVPAGSTGVTSTGGGLLDAPVTATFRTGKYSSARLEQLLAQLGYLPLTWSPLSGSPAPLSDTRAQVNAAYKPPAGTYTWQSGYPSELTSLWRPAKPSLILKGAVMAFEADHHLTLDGIIGSQVWRAMFKAVAAGQMNTHGYSYALASQKLPETLTVWHNGHVIFRNLANTGIPAAPTAVGTDPVYLRYQTQIMKGRNPDGTKYADPVAWVAYFRAGEAVHYFPRYSYGSQQSLGCVELPYQPAKRIWPYLTFGTLVTVTPP